MPRSKQRTPALRDRVLNVALSTLAEDGVSGFTTRRIAAGAHTSVPAVYELFGDKAGLVREVFFEGFRQLRREFERVQPTDDPRADLLHVIDVFHAFGRANPTLVTVMFSRPFADFDPGREDVAAGGAVREFIVGHVRRCLDAGVLHGDPTDIAHVLVALVQGLLTQESAGWLGTSKASVSRRWNVGINALLDGLT